MSMGSRNKNIFKYVAQHSGLSTQHWLCGCNSVVECKLPKLDVTGSNPVARFFIPLVSRERSALKSKMGGLWLNCA